MQTTIRQWGNSQGLCIPKNMLRQLGWSIQDDVEVNVSGDKIIIERVRLNRSKEEAFHKIRQLRKTAADFDGEAELYSYLEERYEGK